MRIVRTLASIALILSIVLQPACSSIDRSDEVNHAHLAIGSSSKSDVVHAIGLPRETHKDDKQGVELWFYTGKPVATSFFIPLPIASVPNGAGTTTYFTDIGPKNIEGKEPISLICIFDKTGRLLDVKRPNQEKQ
ncbi:hypothetical protein D3C85_750910 [compost metagenome]|jgi:hypothetical protein